MPDAAKDPTAWNYANPILEVSDVRRSIAFYRDALDLTPHWMWEDRSGGVMTGEGSIQIYFERTHSPSPSRLSVFVQDADAACEKYRAAGAEIVSEPQTTPWGLRRFTLRDPDGNVIDVSHQVHSPIGHPEYQQLA
jgi:predicted enzyme related to lactoylglutathione lyase